METGQPSGFHPFTKRELQLQKKGVGNLSRGELEERIRTCEEREESVRASKARRAWKQARMEAENRLRSLDARA